MTSGKSFCIAVFPGDGIGPEITDCCLELLNRSSELTGGFSLEFQSLDAGAATYRNRGNAFPAESKEKAYAADAILLSAMGLPEVRYPDGTEIAPQLEMRFELDLYAGVRPARLVSGLVSPLADPRSRQIDFVLIRESTEGLFASRGKGKVEDNKIASETLVITRKTSERLFDYAFNLARKRKAQGGRGRVTCVDKANVFSSFAFFRKIFDERAALNPEIHADYCYVDAMALNLVRQPWEYDVLVTENMFGDILSDLGAALVGGMGMAPSADIGDNHAVFQPCHGSAPDIAGTGKANPTAMYLSAAMMLRWLADTREVPACMDAANLIDAAVDGAFGRQKLLPFESGGDSGTGEIHRAVLTELQKLV